MSDLLKDNIAKMHDAAKHSMKDAFIEVAGSKFAVKQGNNGRVLSLHSTRKAAEKQLAFLHEKNDPKKGARGTSGKAEFGKKAKKAKATGEKEPTML